MGQRISIALGNSLKQKKFKDLMVLEVINLHLEILPSDALCGPCEGFSFWRQQPELLSFSLLKDKIQHFQKLNYSRFSNLLMLKTCD